MTGNSHHITANSTNADGDIRNNKHPKEEEEEEEVPRPTGGGGQEKSVLQAKLTKLAIQIGYAGKELLELLYHFSTFELCFLDIIHSPAYFILTFINLLRCLHFSNFQKETNTRIHLQLPIHFDPI